MGWRTGLVAEYEGIEIPFFIMEFEVRNMPTITRIGKFFIIKCEGITVMAWDVKTGMVFLRRALKRRLQCVGSAYCR
jgi:hypothetical protein